MNLLILHVKKSFNIFHSSVDGYECRSDGLQEILSKCINFDIVCLSETFQQSDESGEPYRYPLLIKRQLNVSTFLFIKRLKQFLFLTILIT